MNPKELTIDWIMDRIQDISFFSPDNCIKYNKLILQKLNKEGKLFSQFEASIYQLFSLKIKYYTQIFKEEEENKVLDLIDFFKKNNNIELSEIGGLFLCRIYLNTKRVPQVEGILAESEPISLNIENSRLKLEYLYMKALMYYYQGKYNQSSRIVFQAMALNVDIRDMTQFSFLRYFEVIHASIFLNLGMYSESLHIANKGFKEVKRRDQKGTLFFLFFNCISLNLLNLKKYSFLEKLILANWTHIENENNMMYKRFHRSILNKIYIQSDQLEKVLPIFPKKRHEVLTNYSLLEYELEKYSVDFILTKKKTNYTKLKKLEEKANQFTENFKISYYKSLIDLAEHFGDIKTAHRAYVCKAKIEEKANNDKAKNLVTGFHIKYEFEKLKKQIKEVEEKAKIKHEFLMGISHDIRSPLAAVISATSLMDSDHLSTDAKKTYIQTAKKSAAGLIEMIDELLEVSSIESRTVKVNLKRFNFHDFLGFIIESHRLVAEEKSLNLELDNTKLSIEDLDSDSHLLQRILSNLLTNAIKYSNQGTISLKVSNDSEFIFIEIEDTGIGIAEDKLSDIFDLYSKSGEESSKRKDSHGLGLFIVKNLVSTLGGKISVTSQLGVGSQFSITLPLIRSN